MYKYCLSLICAVILSAGLFTESARAAQAWSASPETVVNGIGYALDFADADLFEDLVDTQGVCQQAMDLFFDKSRTPEGRAELPPAMALIFSTMGGHVQAKSTVGGMLANETRNFIRYGVASGKFGGKPNAGATPPSGMLANLFASASMGRKEIRDIGQARGIDSRTAVVPFNVYDHDNGNTYPVEAEMQKQGVQWRVVRIANMDAIMKQVSQEASQ